MNEGFNAIITSQSMNKSDNDSIQALVNKLLVLMSHQLK